MLNWLKSNWAAFQQWCAENRKAHEKAPVSPCCSAPPPGAGKRDHS